MSAMKPTAMRQEIKRLREIIQAQGAEHLETKRELSQVKSELDAVNSAYAKLSCQIRNLTAEKSLLESRSGNSGRIIGEMRRQRVEALQAVARVVSMLAETPEYIRLSPPPPAPAPKDEAPF